VEFAPASFEVVAHRLDAGARWLLEASEVPGASVEVVDLVDGSESMRAVLAERLRRPVDDVRVQIVLV
tara:strand:- start:34 stop:237 length:204 start_codon:yes stop_codon:yes gene_type:complete